MFETEEYRIKSLQLNIKIDNCKRIIADQYSTDKDILQAEQDLAIYENELHKLKYD
jgi:hypothetical protein